MKRALIFAALALGALLTMGADKDFRLPGASGGEMTPATLAGGDTIVVVWASWSPKCRDLPQRIKALQGDLGGRAKILSVNFQEGPGQVRQYLAQSPLGVPTYLDRDGRFAKAHAVTNLPGVLVFRQGRQLLKTSLGPDSSRAIRKALDS